MPKKIVEAKVVGQRVLNSSTKLIEVYAPELAELAVPGQFVNVQVFNRTAPLLRRPFGCQQWGQSLSSPTQPHRCGWTASACLSM